MSSSSSYPGWAYFVAGVAMSLFIVFLVYLSNLPEPGDSTLTETSADSQYKSPTFDFYTILPELEIVVPEYKSSKVDPDSIANEISDERATQLPARGVYVLQVGSFKDAQQADKLKASLALIGLEAHIQKVKVNNNTWHRVRIGPFDNQIKLSSAKQRLEENDIRSITLKTDS